MITSLRSRELLWSAMVEAQLLPAADEYARIQRYVTIEGARSRGSIRDRVGHRVWAAALARLPSATPEAEVDRILGFGRLTAEFLAALVAPSPSARGIELGTLANLIVALTDAYADYDPMHRMPVGPPRARPAWRSLLPRVGRAAPTVLLEALIDNYFTGVRAAVSDASRGALLRTAVNRMYWAEVRTLGSTPSPRAVLVRKSALPFVVVGLSASLDAPLSPRQARTYLRWLYAFGAVLGAIDDLVDLETDAARGEANLVLLRGQEGAIELVARRTCGRASALLGQWRTAVPSATRTALGSALPVLLVSWCGGVLPGQVLPSGDYTAGPARGSST